MSVPFIKNVDFKEAEMYKLAAQNDISPKLYDANCVNYIDGVYDETTVKPLDEIQLDPETYDTYKDSVCTITMELYPHNLINYMMENSQNEDRDIEDINEENHKFMKYDEKLIQTGIEGLDKLHSLGIIHNDIHSGNFVMSNDGEMKIIDYGESFYLDDVPEWVTLERFYRNGPPNGFNELTWEDVEDMGLEKGIYETLKYIEREKFLEMLDYIINMKLYVDYD
jgi:serine/threonine protein kinase